MNRSRDGADVFLLSTLLEAADINLEDCDPLAEPDAVDDGGEGANDNTCSTYRLNGVTIQLSVGWNNFYRYVGLTTPFYAYYPIVLPGAGFQQYRSSFDFGNNDNGDRPERSVMDVYGTRIVVTLGGSYSYFYFLAFLITLFTAFGMLKLGKLILDKVMQCLPEGKFYKRAKFEAVRIDLDEAGNLMDKQEQSNVDRRAGGDMETGSIDGEVERKDT